MQHGPQPEAASRQGAEANSTDEPQIINTTREKQKMVAEHHDDSDSRLDAFAATALILIAVCTALYWVASQ